MKSNWWAREETEGSREHKATVVSVGGEQENSRRGVT